MNFLGVDYHHLKTADGGDLYLTNFALPFWRNLLPEHWYEPEWFRSKRLRLDGTSTVYRLPTMNVRGRELDLVQAPAIWLLELSLIDEAGFVRAGQLWHGWPQRLIGALLLWAVFHHLFAGRRLLFLDAGVGVERAAARYSAALVALLGACQTPPTGGQGAGGAWSSERGRSSVPACVGRCAAAPGDSEFPPRPPRHPSVLVQSWLGRPSGRCPAACIPRR
mgnify:CR=1 FL=1